MEKKNTAYIVSYVFISVVLIVSVILFAYSISRLIAHKEGGAEQTVVNRSRRTYVIDAGHGGEDGGAIASDGTTEKDLNLKMSEAVSLIFKLNCNDVRMTRTEDTLLYDCYNDLTDYTGKKKIYDLKNRVRLTEEHADPVYIGIHMNKFTVEKYRGLQVYYSKNNESSAYLANSVQKDTSKYLQPDNKRIIKRADSSIYVLDKLSCPAILIECGFLSNNEELSLLKTEEYRRELSLVIFTSCISANIDKN